MAGANGERPRYRAIACGISSPDPHFEQRHRFHRSETSAHGWCYELLNRPRVPVRAGVTSDTYGPDLPMVLERGERHFPDFAGLLSHRLMIRRATIKEKAPRD